MNKAFALVVLAFALALALCGHVAEGSGGGFTRKRTVEQTDTGSVEAKRVRLAPEGNSVEPRESSQRPREAAVEKLARITTPYVCRRTLDILVNDASSSLRDLGTLHALLEEDQSATESMCGDLKWVPALHDAYAEAKAIFGPMKQWDEECQPFILDSVLFWLHPDYNRDKKQVPARFAWSLTSLWLPDGLVDAARMTRFGNCVNAVQEQQVAEMPRIGLYFENAKDRDLWYHATMANAQSSYNMVHLALTRAKWFSMTQMANMMTLAYVSTTPERQCKLKDELMRLALTFENWFDMEQMAHVIAYAYQFTAHDDRQSRLLDDLVRLEPPMSLMVYCVVLERNLPLLLTNLRGGLHARMQRHELYKLLRDARMHILRLGKMTEYSSELFVATRLFDRDETISVADIFSPQELRQIFTSSETIQNPTLMDQMFGVCMRVQERQSQAIDRGERNNPHMALLGQLNVKCTQWFVGLEQALSGAISGRNSPHIGNFAAVCTLIEAWLQKVVGMLEENSPHAAQFDRLNEKCYWLFLGHQGHQ